SAPLWVCFEPRVSEPPETLSLALIDGIERMPEVRASTRFHLDEAEHILVLRNDVEFALRAPPVAVHNAVTARCQVVRCVFFTCAPEVVFRCHKDSMLARTNL